MLSGSLGVANTWRTAVIPELDYPNVSAER
jgi:hypothetical protein